MLCRQHYGGAVAGIGTKPANQEVSEITLAPQELDVQEKRHSEQQNPPATAEGADRVTASDTEQARAEAVDSANQEE